MIVMYGTMGVGVDCRFNFYEEEVILYFFLLGCFVWMCIPCYYWKCLNKRCFFYDFSLVNFYKHLDEFNKLIVYIRKNIGNFLIFDEIFQHFS